MITVNLIGGMGNQMFQYAYARALSEEFNDKIIRINPYFSKFCNLISDYTFKMTPNALTNLVLNPYSIEIGKIYGIYKSILDFVDFAYNTKIANDMTPEKYIKRSEKGVYMLNKFLYTYFEHSKISIPNKTVTGYYQSGKYFSKIRPILLREFQVKKEPTKANKLMIEELSSCDSVCVHIRRGDYLNPRWSYLNICNEDYYRRGINYIAEHTENPVFYIFSNTHEEIEWIKNNYKFDHPVKYVDLNNPDYEDLRLMYNCKHFVMSNSTFSWWGSYLSQNEDKIIVVPEKWQNAPYDNKFDIYTDNMIKIPINTEVTK